MKVKKTYRLEEETIRELEKLCEATGKTATEVIEAAIRDAIREPYDESGPDRVGDGWAQTVAALTEQLAVKDGQIASLGRALESAQETAKAARRSTRRTSRRGRWGAAGRKRAVVGGGPGATCNPKHTKLDRNDGREPPRPSFLSSVLRDLCGGDPVDLVVDHTFKFAHLPFGFCRGEDLRCGGSD